MTRAIVEGAVLLLMGFVVVLLLGSLFSLPGAHAELAAPIVPTVVHRSPSRR